MTPDVERAIEVPADAEDRMMERLCQEGIVGPRLGLGYENLARVKRLAKVQGVTPETMLTAVVASGLDVCEMAEREAPAAPLRPTDPMGEGWPSSMPSPWLGWAILVLVALVVGGGGWALVRRLDRRARPALLPVGPASSTVTAASAPARRAAPPPRLTPHPETRDPRGG